MQRRAFVLAWLVVPVTLSQAKAADSIRVIYIGGKDCAPCANWKQRYRADWLASAEYKRVIYTEVESPKLKEAYQERYWQGDLKPILEQIPAKKGTPRFLIVKDGKIVANMFDRDNWPSIMSALKKMLS